MNCLTAYSVPPRCAPLAAGEPWKCGQCVDELIFKFYLSRLISIYIHRAACGPSCWGGQYTLGSCVPVTAWALLSSTSRLCQPRCSSFLKPDGLAHPPHPYSIWRFFCRELTHVPWNPCDRGRQSLALGSARVAFLFTVRSVLHSWASLAANAKPFLTDSLPLQLLTWSQQRQGAL